VHLFRPPNEELYGARMEVHLAERLRGDRAFASLDELRVQIAADVDRAMRMLHSLPEPAAPIGG